MPRRGQRPKKSVCPRKKAIWVQVEYHEAVMALADYFDVDHMGAVVEPALRALFEAMPDDIERGVLLALISDAVDSDHISVGQSEEVPAEPIQSRVGPRGSNGKPQFATLGI